MSLIVLSAIDKRKHFAVGFAIALIVAVALTLLGIVEPEAGSYFGVLLAVGAGFAKEYWDRRHPGHVPDGWDAYATCLGAVVAPPAVPFVVLAFGALT